MQHDNSDDLIQFRQTRADALALLADAVKPDNAVIVMFTHDKLKDIVGLRNVALMREISYCMGFPDMWFLPHFVLGMPMVAA